MTSITVWKFNTPEGAEQALSKFESLSKQQLITIEDAAIVTWQPGKKKPKIRQLHSMAGAGALGGAFWGLWKYLINLDLARRQILLFAKECQSCAESDNL